MCESDIVMTWSVPILYVQESREKLGSYTNEGVGISSSDIFDTHYIGGRNRVFKEPE